MSLGVIGRTDYSASRHGSEIIFGTAGKGLTNRMRRIQGQLVCAEQLDDYMLPETADKQNLPGQLIAAVAEPDDFGQVQITLVYADGVYGVI